MIPAACPAGTRRIMATVKTDCPDAPWVEYAMMVVPAGTPATFPTEQKPAPASARLSEWLRLPPNPPGTIALPLDEAPSQTMDLHIATTTEDSRVGPAVVNQRNPRWMPTQYK